MLEQRKLVSGSMSGSRPATKELPLAMKSTRMFQKNVGKMGNVAEKEWKNTEGRMMFHHTPSLEDNKRYSMNLSIIY